MNLSSNTKKIIVIIASVFCVLICIGVTYFSISNKKYDTYKNNIVTTSSSNNQDTKINGNNLQTSENTKIAVPAKLKIDDFAKQAYELKNFIAIDSFKSIKNISVDQAVQYAFCYLFTDGKCLVDYNIGKMVYRQASKKDIVSEITKLFGSCPYDVTKSNLYNATKGNFEMWQPNYYSEVYTSATVTSAKNGKYVITADYFETSDKTQKVMSVNIKVAKNSNGNFYILSMS